MTHRASPHHWLARAVLLVVLLATYAPVAMVLLYSFTESRLGTVWTGFSLRWYGELWKQDQLWESLVTSLVVGGVASTLSVILGLMAALGLRRWWPRPRRLVTGLLALPLVAPEIMLGLSLAAFFHAASVPKGMLTVILGHTAFGVAYAFVVLSAAVADLDENLYAAALDCGATPWQSFRLVLLPVLLPSVVVAWLLVFALSFDDFFITFFSKGLEGDTLPIKIYSQLRFGVEPSTNALFALLFVVTLMGALLAVWVGRRSPVLAER